MAPPATAPGRPETSTSQATECAGAAGAWNRAPGGAVPDPPANGGHSGTNARDDPAHERLRDERRHEDGNQPREPSLCRLRRRDPERDPATLQAVLRLPGQRTRNYSRSAASDTRWLEAVGTRRSSLLQEPAAPPG